MNLDKLIAFIKMTNQFRMVTRHNEAVGEKRKENDAEHSYQLAMVAWYLVSSDKFSLNSDLVVKYALVHDLIEVYAGDTLFFRSEHETIEKNNREKISQERLQKEFPDFPDAHNLIKAYEERKDRESCFVYALDKLLPVIANYLNDGKDWRDIGITYDRVWNRKLEKINISSEIKPYFEEIIEILSQNKHLFHVEQKEK